jgi:hypothetical protein
MIISDDLSYSYDEGCSIIARGEHEGIVYVDPTGCVWAEGDGQWREVKDFLIDEEDKDREAREQEEQGRQNLSWQLEAERQRWEESEDRYGYDPGGW